MTPEELHAEWTGGEQTGVRPARVQRLRHDIIKHTGLEPPRRRGEIETWLKKYKGEVTKRLNKEVDNE